MKLRLLVALLFVAVTAMHAQTSTGLWSQASLATTAKGTNVFAQSYQPSSYISFQLDESGMKSLLAKAPSEKTVSASKSSFIITVPNAKGKLESYRLVEASVMQEGLQAKHPDIRSYAGRGIDQPTSYIRCDMTPEGFHAIIFSSERNTIYINPVNKKSQSYIVFDRDHLSSKKEVFDCKAEVVANAAKQAITEKNANDGKLRTYRFAVSTGGEFSALLLNGTETTDAQKKASVLAGLVTDLTRVDGILEADFDVRLNYVNNEDTIIFLDGSTDPYLSSQTGYTSGKWNTQAEAAMDSYIGSANYDVGHLLMGYPTGGNAGCIGCVCTAGTKGEGVTGFTDNLTSDPFVVDFWIHEIGHQFGANHTFDYSYEGSGAQMEPGSGITIMGYAGTTGSYDIAPHSIPNFHSFSIQQCTNYIMTGNGSKCGTSTATGDNIPVANAGADYTVPKSTPFALTGSATDADANDSLTYCWEQFDNFVKSTSSAIPAATSTTGPQFRPYSPTSAAVRYFPIITNILDGSNTNEWEVLPSVARTMNFRLTVRDNKPGGGSNNSDDMVVTVSSASGPFAVTAPNTAVTYTGGSTQTVTWSVASTTAAPVSCASVNILLSTDGGTTFPYALASAVANNGTASVVIPNIATTTARVKVQSVGNIFFDISNTNFTITAGAQSCGVPSGLVSSAITTSTATVSWAAVTGANNYDVDYKIHTATSWTNAATATTALTVNLSTLTASTLYDWRVRSNCSVGSSVYDTAQFTTAAVVSTKCNGIYDTTTHITFATAVAIPLNTNVYGTVSSATDADHYSFVISKKGTITIHLTNLPADYDLALYNSSNSLLQSSKTRGTGDETISRNVAKGKFYVTVVGYKKAFDTLHCYTLNVTTGTASKPDEDGSTDRLTASDALLLFPNPAHSVLNVKGAKIQAGAVIKIADMYGRAVIMQQSASSNSQVNIDKLTPGIYLLTVVDKNGIVAYTSKFVKQ